MQETFTKLMGNFGPDKNNTFSWCDDSGKMKFNSPVRRVQIVFS